MKNRNDRLYKIFSCLFLLFFAQVTMATSANESFQQLADQYFDTVYLPAKPSEAVLLGLHQYDAQLEDYSKTTIQHQVKQLKEFEKRVVAVPAAQLDETAQGDRELLLNNIRAQLLTLQNIRPYEKDPDFYSGTLTNGAFVIMSRNFAPADDRIRALIAREKKMPALLAEAKKNLKNPPKIYTEIAIEQLPGMITFFEKDVPAAFTMVTDPALKAAFAKSNAEVISALQSYQAWLKADLLPRSHGDFRLGTKNYRKKLQYEEMIDLPLPALLQIGRDNLHENQVAYQAVLRDLADDHTGKPTKTSMGADHPAPDDLLKTFSSSFDGLISFIKQKNIITIPSDVRPTMEETPPFMRATTFASMDTPGPFETVAKQAFFNVTLPASTWDVKKVDEYMDSFSYPAIKFIAIHETYPGHYVQFLWVPKVPSRTRKILGARTNVEGWAHYCEQMMLEQGYGQSGTTREANLIKLGQLQNALLRNARFIVGIEMHTGKMSFDQAVNFFVKEGYQSKTTGIIETKRGTTDATYLYYTLGKLEILKLRHDLEAKEGDAFSLQKFHDDFMMQGYPPIKIVRKALMKDDSPTL